MRSSLGKDAAARAWVAGVLFKAKSRAGQFVILAFLVIAATSFPFVVSTSLFLAHAGASAIPVYYMLFAVVAIPLSLGFSSIIDRWPRHHTLLGMLLLLALVTLGGSIGLGGRLEGYYALYLGVSVLEVLIISVFFVLFADYFTVTEAKRLSGPLALAMALGALTGGGLVGVLTSVADIQSLLFVSPLLIAAAGLLILWITRRETPLDEAASAPEVGLLESLRDLPAMAKRYHIVGLMALAVFLNIFLQCVMEYAAFSIYAKYYPDANMLAAFLGIVYAGMGLLGVGLVFFVTNPLIPRLGVAQMNLVVPSVNVATFSMLALSSTLPLGILAHVNYSPLERNVGTPVFALTYNAVPHRFIGRVRMAIDGVMYPLALAIAGLLLKLTENVLSLQETALIGAFIALLFLLVQWGVGKQYVRGLTQMMSDGAVNLDIAGKGLKVPEHYKQDIRAMIASRNRDEVTLGLELASRCDVALSVNDFNRALPVVTAKVARLALVSFVASQKARAQETLWQLVDVSKGIVLVRALETIALSGWDRQGDRFSEFQKSADETLRAISFACSYDEDPAGVGLSLAQMSEDSVLSAIYVVGRHPFQCNRLPLLLQLSTHLSPLVRAEALALATQGATVADTGLVALGWRGWADTDGRVRMQAGRLLARTSAESALFKLCEAACCDPLREVRHSTLTALGERGACMARILSERLRISDADVATDLMAGIGMLGAAEAESILYSFLADCVFPDVARNLAVSGRMPSNRPEWRAMEMVISDNNSRAIRLVLSALSVLGYKRILGLVRTALIVGEPRARAQAIETLSSLMHRRFVLPLIPLLEAAHPVPRPAFNIENAKTLLIDLSRSADAYLRAAGVLAWQADFGEIPHGIESDPSPFVAATLRSQRAGFHWYHEDAVMNRLVFLKSVALFSEMSLDHLLAIDEIMLRESYLPGEAIVREGDVGSKLYIVFRGCVAVRKRATDANESELAQLSSGQLFGEMALFDNDRRSATVVALVETELLSIDRDRFNSLAYQRPEMPMQIAKVLAQRLRAANS